MNPLPPIVLASTSQYRRELLQRLQIPFTVASPDIGESTLSGESPVQTAERLAEAKARAVGANHAGALIIGSDQVAYLGDRRFGKPLVRERAIEQLQAMRGKTVIFHTAVCLYNTRNGNAPVVAVPTEVRFRDLSDAEIERYVDKERPFHCAGSAKSEGLGIALLEYLRGDDPNALIGLPLIALCALLRAEGYELP